MITRCWAFAKQRVDILLLFFIGLGFIYSSLESFWTDSEMWASVVAKYMFQNEMPYSFAIKPLFNLFLWINYQWSAALDVHPMVTGRFLMALNALFCAYLVGKILFFLTKNYALALVGVFLLFGFSTFFKRAANVRSDMLVTTCLLFGVYIHLVYSTSRIKGILSPSFLWISALLVSPKSIFFSGALLVYNLSKKILIGGVFVIIILFFFFGKEGLRDYFLNSWLFFIHSFTEKETGLSYFDPIRFMHIVRFFKENIFLILGFAIFVFFNHTKAVTVKKNKEVSLLAGISVLLLLFYPDRLPFLISSVLPFLILFICLHFGSAWVKNKTYWIFILSCSLASLYWSKDMTQHHSNKEQRVVSAWLDQQFMQAPELNIWDPSGILPHSNAHYFFLGPAQHKDNHRNIFNIRDGITDIFLYTSKAYYIEPELSQYLKDKYHNVAGGVFVRKDLPQKMDPLVFDQLWRQLREGLKGQQLTELFRFDFEY